MSQAGPPSYALPSIFHLPSSYRTAHLALTLHGFSCTNFPNPSPILSRTCRVCHSNTTQSSHQLVLARVAIAVMKSMTKARWGRKGLCQLILPGIWRDHQGKSTSPGIAPLTMSLDSPINLSKYPTADSYRSSSLLLDDSSLSQADIKFANIHSYSW